VKDPLKTAGSLEPPPIECFLMKVQFVSFKNFCHRLHLMPAKLVSIVVVVVSNLLITGIPILNCWSGSALKFWLNRQSIIFRNICLGGTPLLDCQTLSTSSLTLVGLSPLNITPGVLVGRLSSNFFAHHSFTLHCIGPVIGLSHGG
jgi:hypothetical protein